MLTRQTMGGVYALPPTPFTKSGEFDEDALRHNVRALAAAGADAVVTTGSNGEFHTMPFEMLKELIVAQVDETPDGVKAIVGCSAVNTEEAIERTRFAMEAGADAVMNVSPYYVGLTDPELLQFWIDVAEACPDIGIIIYNNPSTAQIHRTHILKQLQKLPNLCGTKEGHNDFDLFKELMEETDLAIMTATELTWFVPGMMLGTKGIFSMAAAHFPHFVVKLYNTCKEGRWDEALKMEKRLREGTEGLSGHPSMGSLNGIARFKARCNATGILRCGKNRKPLISASDDQQAELTEYAQKEFADLITP